MPADNTVITDTAKVETPPEDKKDKSLGQEVREKSFVQLLREQKAAAQKPVTEEAAPVHTAEDDKKAEDERLAKEAEEAKTAIESDEKRQADLAKKAAEEVIAKQKADEDAKIAAVQKEADEKARQEALKPKFTGVDKDGNVVPKDYEEIAQESARIAKAEARAEVIAELEAKEAAKQKEQETKKATEAQKENARKEFEAKLQTELDRDLTDLYAGGKLPKIKDPNDKNDLGNREFANLFETAQRVNAERMAKGEPAISNIKLIYYEHYKPLSNPAGHDAPVMGAEPSLSQEAPEDRYVPARDRNKSMKQLVREEAARLAKKLNVRGA